MGVVIVQGTKVNRPTPDRVTSSVLDHATVVTNPKFVLTNNAGLWPSYNCLDMLVPTALCADPVAVKVFDYAEWVPALDGVVYGAVQCSMVGLDEADQLSEIERVFALAEGKGIEQMLLLNRFVATDSDAVVQWDAPEDLTPGSDISLSVALALLEGHAAALYAGLPTIHMPRAAATLLEVNGLIVWEGDKAFTKNGSKVAMGGGYDDATMLASGEWDLYATGEVYVERAPAIKTRQWQTGPGFMAAQAASSRGGVPYDEGADPNLMDDNTMIALAERMNRVAVDCFVAKATGTVF